MTTEETNNTINFAGRDIDKLEFARRALAKLGEYIAYQGLQGQEIDDFVKTLNDRMNGLYNGVYTTTDFGLIQGTNNLSYQYRTRDGQRSNGGFSLSRRENVNPGQLVEIYLNGIAGTMKTPKEDNKPSSTHGSNKWNKNLLAKRIIESIAGEDNELSAAQLKLWADQRDKVENGVRGILGRQKYLSDAIDAYRDELNSGAFEMTDEEKAKELQRIDKLQEALINGNVFEMNKYAPWLNNLLFTDEEYYPDETSKNTADLKNFEKKVKDYILNGGTNPYNKETEPEKWQETENARKALLDKNFADEFANYSVRSENLRGEHFLPKWDAVDESVFSEWNPLGPNGWKSMLDAWWDVNTDYSGNLQLGADLKSGPLGIGGDSATPNNAFDGIIPKAYTDLFKPNKWLSGHQTEGSHMFRSPSAYKGKYLSDYLNYWVKKDPARFRIKEGTQSYLLPSMVDWENGTAYILTLDLDSKSKLRQINIADILPALKEDNPSLYNELLQEYAKFKNYLYNPQVQSAKQGGILKALFGEALNATANYKKIEDERASRNPAGNKDYQRKLLENLKITDGGLNATDYARIGAAAADLTSAIAAWVPGYGTAVSAVTGVGSSIVNFGADIYDPTVSTGLVLTNLGINLGLDIASLVPAAGTAASVAKITKTAGKTLSKISKWTPAVLAGYGLTTTAGPFLEAVNKLTTDPKNITVGDLKNIAYGLSAIAGGSRVGAQALKRAYYKHKRAKAVPEGTSTGEFKVDYTHNGTTDNVTLKKADIEAVNSLHTQEAALKVFQEKIAAATGKNKDEISFANGETFGKKLGFRNKKLKGDEQFNKVDKEAAIQYELGLLEQLNKSRQGFWGRLMGGRGQHNIEIFGGIPAVTTGAHPVYLSRIGDAIHDWYGKRWGEPNYTPRAVKRAKSKRMLTRLASEIENSTHISPKTTTAINNANTNINNALNEITTNKGIISTADSRSDKGVNEFLPKLELKVLAHEQAKAIPNLDTQIAQNEAKASQIDSDLAGYLSMRKSSTNSAADEAYIKQEVTRLWAERYRTRSKIADLKRAKKSLLADTRYQSMLREVDNLKKAANAKTKRAEAQTKIDEGQKLIDAENKRIEDLKALGKWDTYEYYKKLMKKIYQMKSGGILKANLGAVAPPSVKPPKEETQPVGLEEGELGMEEGEFGTEPSSLITNPGEQLHLYAPTGNLSFRKYPEGSGMITALQELENGIVRRTNLDQKYLEYAKLPAILWPMRNELKTHTPIDIERSLRLISNLFNRLARNAASSTADPGAAMAYQVALIDNKAKHEADAAAKISLFLKNTEDAVQTNEWNNHKMDHDTHIKNAEALAAYNNNNRLADLIYNRNAANEQIKDIQLRQKGIALTAQNNYKRNMYYTIQSDPTLRSWKAEYQNLAYKGSELTEEDKARMKELKKFIDRRSQDLQELFMYLNDVTDGNAYIGPSQRFKIDYGFNYYGV